MPFRSAAFLSAWQVRHSAYGVAVMSFTRVTSLVTRISWQLVQPVAMAEWTDFALGFVLMTLDALGGVCVLVQRYGMGGRAAEAGAQNQAQSQK